MTRTRDGYRATTMPAGTGPRLNIGCGQFKLADWINLDADPRVHPDICATVPPLSFEDGTVGEIYAGHLLEHLAFEDGAWLLRECWRVLVPGGRLGVVVPDTRVIMARWLGGSQTTVEIPTGRIWRMDDLDDVCGVFLFSTYQDSHHQWAYDAITLRRAVERAGFRVTGEIDRYHDPRLSNPTWYSCGVDAVKEPG